jgi:copper(I)-binding protein
MRRGWLFALMAVLLGACQPTAPPYQLLKAEYRAPLAGSDIGVVYMTVVSRKADALVGAESPSVERIEIHETVVDGAVGRMQRVERVELPGGEPVAFEPGGLHLMVIGARPLAPPATLDLTLSFASGAKETFQVAVWTPASR